MDKGLDAAELRRFLDTREHGGMTELERMSGVSVTSIRKARDGKPVSRDTWKKLDTAVRMMREEPSSYGGDSGLWSQVAADLRRLADFLVDPDPRITDDFKAQRLTESAGMIQAYADAIASGTERREK